LDVGESMLLARIFSERRSVVSLSGSRRSVPHPGLAFAATIKFDRQMDKWNLRNGNR